MVLLFLFVSEKPSLSFDFESTAVHRRFLRFEICCFSLSPIESVLSWIISCVLSSLGDKKKSRGV